MEVQDPPYSEKVYNALKSKVDGFNLTPEQFNERIKDTQYQKNVYGALKSKVEGFNLEEADFYDRVKKKDSGVPYFLAAPDGQKISSPNIPQPETSELMANGLTEEQDKQKSLQELAITPNGNPINIQQKPTDQEQQGLDFLDQYRQTQEKELRQIAGVDEKPMTALEIHNSTLGAFNKPIVDMVSSIPKAGAIVRKAADDVFLGESQPIENYDLYKLGKAIDKGALDIGLTATDPRSAGDVKELLASGLGSATSLMLLGGRGGATETMAKSALEGVSLVSATKKTIKELAGHMTSPMGLAGANVMGMQEMERALASGANDEQAFGVYLANAGLGSTESVTFARALDRLNKITDGNVMKFLTASTQGGVEESIQEGVQTYLSNKIAQGTYDPNRESWEDMISSMGVGAFVGFILPGIMHFANNLPSDQGKATMAAVNEALKNHPQADLGNQTTTKDEEKPIEEVGTSAKITTQKENPNLDGRALIDVNDSKGNHIGTIGIFTRSGIYEKDGKKYAAISGVTTNSEFRGKGRAIDLYRHGIEEAKKLGFAGLYSTDDEVVEKKAINKIREKLVVEDLGNGEYLYTGIKAEPKEEYVPKDGWEGNLMKAREYAQALGIDFKGKELGEIVSGIQKKQEVEKVGSGVGGDVKNDAPETRPITDPLTAKQRAKVDELVKNSKQKTDAEIRENVIKSLQSDLNISREEAETLVDKKFITEQYLPTQAEAKKDGSNTVVPREGAQDTEEVKDTLPEMEDIKDIRNVRDLSDKDAEIQQGLVSGAVFSALKKGETFKVGKREYTVENISKPVQNHYYTKKDNKKVDYKKSTIKIRDDKGVAITAEFWQYPNGNGKWMGRGQTKKQDKWGQLSRDIEGDIVLDLINENNQFHEKTDSYKKAQEYIDSLTTDEVAKKPVTQDVTPETEKKKLALPVGPNGEMVNTTVSKKRLKGILDMKRMKLETAGINPDNPTESQKKDGQYEEYAAVLKAYNEFDQAVTDEISKKEPVTQDVTPEKLLSEGDPTSFGIGITTDEKGKEVASLTFFKKGSEFSPDAPKGLAGIPLQTIDIPNSEYIEYKNATKKGNNPKEYKDIADNWARKYWDQLTGQQPSEDVTPEPERVFRSKEDVERISTQTLPSHLKDTPVTIKGPDGKPKKMKAKDAYVSVKKVHKLLNSKKFLDCIGRG